MTADSQAEQEAALATAWREYVNVLRPYVFGEPPEHELREGRRAVEAAARAAGRAEAERALRSAATRLLYWYDSDITEWEKRYPGERDWRAEEGWAALRRALLSEGDEVKP